MSTKLKHYPNIAFLADDIREAEKTFMALLGATPPSENAILRTVRLGLEQWTYDSDDQFFARYRKPFQDARYYKRFDKERAEFTVNYSAAVTTVTIQMSSEASIETVSEVFERSLSRAMSVVPQKHEDLGRVFIGHGHDPQWMLLEQFLRGSFGYQTSAYEVGSRAGHAIRDILEEMLKHSAFAILVFTGEDDTAQGYVRARQNVVHEAGLFQGRLGFSKVALVVERGIELFSNIEGIQYIPFTKGNIREAQGEVLAALRREGIVAGKPSG